MKHVLITGGAGFIGSHLGDELLRRGVRVRAFDRLDAQVHGENASRPEYLDERIELQVGELTDRVATRRALDGVDAVVHLAAAVGVGQSMYQIAHYTRSNNLGTAVLLEELAGRPVERLVVASSMSVYGEGLYRDASGRTVTAPRRPRRSLEAGEWELYDDDGESLEPIPTPESKPPDLSSVYALSKYDQERLCLMLGDVYDIPTAALRFFNVYGSRQALSNPYTGVMAIFASRILNGNPPVIFEDGRQRRDFVHASDVAQAIVLALDKTEDVDGEVLNVGSGTSWTVREIADRVGRALGHERLLLDVTGEYRVGDIRHCFADIGKARDLLGYAPRVGLEDGLAELVPWLRRQHATDRVDEARRELATRGLTR